MNSALILSRKAGTVEDYEGKNRPYSSACCNLKPQQLPLKIDVKGIVQPFELGGVTRLIRSIKKFLMVQSHERSLKLICAA